MTAIYGNNPALSTYYEPPTLGKFAAVSVPEDQDQCDEATEPRPFYPPELSVWHRVDSELKSFESAHHQYWWRQETGKALAILLHNAGYPSNVQYRDLKFFAEVVAPHLGVSRNTSDHDTPIWPSFMTDDGNPVELSWDWGNGDKPPTIRYSIEPIGLQAGTPLDPKNQLAGPAFLKQLVWRLPEARLEWYYHFSEYLNCSPATPSMAPGSMKDIADHNTCIFYAFDLSPKEITAKVYFFPKIRAAIENRSNLDVLSQAIYNAPFSTGENLKAWSAFYDFASEPSNKTLEHEMLAIDLIDPMQSRLKIYFRCRETTFDSVINVMTLGGRIRSLDLFRGLIDLARLWNLLFDIEGPLTQPLGDVGHRTAGILYNVEFRLGETRPVAKIYLPVRHYSRSDDAVIRGLEKYFQYHHKGKDMADYVRVMHTLFSPESLRAWAGVQTYVGCSIRPNGSLRVVSYFKL
ncbi:aromatic prenyltransferase [Lentithecium fluviatile CBS 122367]|uniref:Aromatic prenyltransferase n=1 Tax=Lentithecium fluviatile CBS 122367 TaxID=1168545 RepID=A0A6G1IE23_9PLEO|nr:aromatic prenyltransferase [Lentithecium fluviatile CBS 122367]